MILIPCPNCGPRDEGEFTYGGPRRAFPALGGSAGTDDWYQALYQSPNPRGALRELWYHTSGCECWIEVTRDTGTHQITEGGAPDPSEPGP